MLMYSLHVRICKSLVQGQPNISQFPCTVPIYNKSAKTFRDASQEPISNDFSISEMSAIFPVIGVANGALYTQQAHPKDICFREVDDKTKLNFPSSYQYPKPFIFVSNRQECKKRHVLTFLCPFYPLRKTMWEITQFAYKAANWVS